ncbi:hypothetical protein QQF64_008582 [Cirrhinus molitorella]|uniref:Uncharacterized protein n=1 Tax=Cirrhinus molitorella TaxID=172907 RepID=A0ABR3M7Z6_9TELE
MGESAHDRALSVHVFFGASLNTIASPLFPASQVLRHTSPRKLFFKTRFFIQFCTGLQVAQDLFLSPTVKRKVKEKSDLHFYT